MLEFSCDYNKPINESWQLVRNWATGLNSSYASADYGTGMDLWPMSGFTDIVTLPSGHTVGMIPELFPNWPWNSSDSFAQVVELLSIAGNVTLATHSTAAQQILMDRSPSHVVLYDPEPRLGA